MISTWLTYSLLAVKKTFTVKDEKRHIFRESKARDVDCEQPS